MIDPTVWQRVHIAAPPILSLRTQSYVETIAFFEAIREAVLRDSKKLILNFRECSTISAEVLPLLVAEIQRVKHFRGGDVLLTTRGGSDIVNYTLATIQARWGIGLAGATRIGDALPSVLDVKTGVLLDGGVAAEMAQQFSGAIGLPAEKVNDVIIALKEALENISEHAYPAEIEPVHQAERGRWWIAQVANSDEAYLLACDLGVTIPKTVPLTVERRGESNVRALSTFMKRRKRAKPTDEDLLAAAFDEGVTRREDRRGGRGLTRMAQISRLMGHGQLLVISGGAAAFISHDNENVRTRKLPVPFNGTHILWNLNRNQDVGSQDAG